MDLWKLFGSPEIREKKTAEVQVRGDACLIKKGCWAGKERGYIRTIEGTWTVLGDWPCKERIWLLPRGQLGWEGEWWYHSERENSAWVVATSHFCTCLVICSQAPRVFLLISRALRHQDAPTHTWGRVHSPNPSQGKGQAEDKSLYSSLSPLYCYCIVKDWLKGNEARGVGRTYTIHPENPTHPGWIQRLTSLLFPVGGEVR